MSNLSITVAAIAVLLIKQLLQSAGIAVPEGDVQTFSLTLAAPCKGQAWLRANLGRAEIIRHEILAEIEIGSPRLGQDWFDLPMRRRNDREFNIRIPLNQVGHFEAKVFFLPEGSPDPVWPSGTNTAINVQLGQCISL